MSKLLLGAGSGGGGGGSNVNFVRLHVNRGSAGNNIIDIEYDAAPPSAAEGGITIEIKALIGDDQAYTTIANTLYTATIVNTVYIRYTLSGNIVNDIQAGHQLRYSHDGTTSGIATESNLTTMTNSSTVNLLDGLTIVYLLNESSGNPVDSIGTRDLTNNNTVPFSAGKNGNAADLSSVSSHYFNVLEDWSLATNNLHIAMSIKLNSLQQKAKISQWGTTAANRGYKIMHVNVGDLFYFIVRNSSGTTKTVIATNSGAKTTGVWYCVQAWVDVDVASSEEIDIEVDGTAETATALATAGLNDSTDDLELGRQNATNLDDGSLDNIHLWIGRSAAFTQAERDSFRASGNINPYPCKPR